MCTSLMPGPAPLVRLVQLNQNFFLVVIVPCFFGRDPAADKLHCSCCHERFNITDMSTKVT